MNANELADELDYACTVAEPRIEMMKRMKLCATMLRQQQAEIERLVGSEPITYGMLTICKNCGQQNPYPAKTLTDEEIRHIQAICHLKDVGYDNFVMRFARAILRKAQDK